MRNIYSAGLDEIVLFAFWTENVIVSWICVLDSVIVLFVAMNVLLAMSSVWSFFVIVSMWRWTMYAATDW